MRVLVCIKQVRALGDEIEFTDDHRDVRPDFLSASLNEWDSFAVEEALRLRDANGGEAVAVTCGGPEADTALQRCLAMGVDRAIRIEPAGRDPFSVARALAEVARSEAPELILCGAQSSDWGQAATGTALAGSLGLPAVAVVKRIDYDADTGRAIVDRELEGGLIDRVRVETPAVLTVQTGINQPRYANLRAIKQAEREPIDVRQSATDAPPAYRIRRMFVPQQEGRAETLAGDAPEVARRIAAILKERLS